MYILSIIFLLTLIYFIFTFILFISQRNLLYLPVENNYQGDELTLDIQKVKVITNDNFELLAWYHKKDISNYKTGGLCETPAYYCSVCESGQIGIGNPVNTTLVSNTTKWSDIFPDTDDMNSWLGPPNNGGNIACDPNFFPRYKDKV